MEVGGWIGYRLDDTVAMLESLWEGGCVGRSAQRLPDGPERCKTFQSAQNLTEIDAESPKRLESVLANLWTPKATQQGGQSALERQLTRGSQGVSSEGAGIEESALEVANRVGSA